MGLNYSKNSILLILLVDNSVKDMKFLLVCYLFIRQHFWLTSCLRQERNSFYHLVFEVFEYLKGWHEPVVMLIVINFFDIWCFLFFYFLFLFGNFLGFCNNWFWLFNNCLGVNWLASFGLSGFRLLFLIQLLKIILHQRLSALCGCLKLINRIAFWLTIFFWRKLILDLFFNLAF